MKEWSQQPLISIVVPVHNAASWLGETLDSIFSQSESDFEIILVDDASTDELNELLKRYTDNRMRVVRLRTNVGVSSARNHGIDLASGRYIAFCDADDICQPQRFTVQKNFLEQHPDVSLCGSAFTCFDSISRETVQHPLTNAQIRKALMFGNAFGLSTVMARAAVLKEHNFDRNSVFAEDYDLWTRIVASGVQVANLPESLIRYRLHPDQASRHNGSRLDQMSRQIRARYCASLLGDGVLVKKLASGYMTNKDLTLAAERVADFVIQNPEFLARDFRFMLAWIYQLLPNHSLQTWLFWTSIQRSLKLELDRNYRFNIALLALLPSTPKRMYFETLIKLKR